MSACLFALIGQESADNLRLSQILRRIYGEGNVFRYLELPHLLSFLAEHVESPIVVCVDLFSLDLGEATETIGQIRDTYRRVVFNLYVDQDEYRSRRDELPGPWRDRFVHYHKTFKEGQDVEYEPIVRSSIRPSQLEAEYNMNHQPIRLSPSFNKGLIAPEDHLPEEPDSANTTFISYSRHDWSEFVSDLVNHLTRQSLTVWVDQSLIVGGDDWMDSVGEALRLCSTLVLVLSPEALASRYVKMEYRYFFRQEKPIVPLLYRRVEEVPIELSTIQYIDFTTIDRQPSYSKLVDVLKRHRSKTRSG